MILVVLHSPISNVLSVDDSKPMRMIEVSRRWNTFLNKTSPKRVPNSTKKYTLIFDAVKYSFKQKIAKNNNIIPFYQNCGESAIGNE